MKAEELIKYLGYSIKSQNIKKLMIEFGIELKPRAFFQQQKNRTNVDLRDELNEVILLFWGYNRYREEFGVPKKIINTAEDELILTQINFNNNDIDGKTSFSIDLPFGLLLKDSKKEVLSKIGKKPNEQHPTDYGAALFFKMNEYSIIVALNKENQLIWLNIHKYNKAELGKIKLKKELSIQRKNIKPENEKQVLDFIKKLPTVEWRKRMQEKDDVFTEGNIAAIELLLKDYIKQLAAYTKDRKASNIFNSIKKLVNKINKIDKKHGYFIYTMEREDICGFIDEIVKATGFVIEDGIDLTEEWREW